MLFSELWLTDRYKEKIAADRRKPGHQLTNTIVGGILLTSSLSSQRVLPDHGKTRVHIVRPLEWFRPLRKYFCKQEIITNQNNWRHLCADSVASIKVQTHKFVVVAMLGIFQGTALLRMRACVPHVNDPRLAYTYNSIMLRAAVHLRLQTKKGRKQCADLSSERQRNAVYSNKLISKK